MVTGWKCTTYDEAFGSCHDETFELPSFKEPLIINDKYGINYYKNNAWSTYKDSNHTGMNDYLVGRNVASREILLDPSIDSEKTWDSFYGSGEWRGLFR